MITNSSDATAPCVKKVPLLALLVLLGVVTVGCAPGDGPTYEPGAIDYLALADDVAPLAEPLGWEVQRAYEQPAYVFGRDVQLANVYLRPAGAEPSPEEFLDDALVALRTIASALLAGRPDVTAVDVCLQRSNDAPATEEVPSAVRLLGLREDEATFTAADVSWVGLIGLSRARRFVLFVDDWVAQAPAWKQALAEAGPPPTTVPGPGPPG